jgi:hypothetical protein
MRNLIYGMGKRKRGIMRSYWRCQDGIRTPRILSWDITGIFRKESLKTPLLTPLTHTHTLHNPIGREREIF